MSPVTAFVFLASPRAGRSETGALAIARHLEARGIAVDVVRQADLPLVAAGLSSEDYPPAIADALERSAVADMHVFAGPVHRGRISGVMRNSLELFRDHLEGKPIAVAVGVGSDRAQLAADDLRADLFINFRCDPVGALVVSGTTADAELDRRAGEIADKLGASPLALV